MKQLSLGGLALIASCVAAFASPSIDMTFDLQPPSLMVVAEIDGADLTELHVANLQIAATEGTEAMLVGHIEGATRVIGKSQGYLGLPVRDVTVNCTVNGEDTPAMVTAWHPTPDELDALANGAPVYVQLLGQSHPPIMVGVGPEPDPV